jgi:GxxExxY protein
VEEYSARVAIFDAEAQRRRGRKGEKTEKKQMREENEITERIIGAAIEVHRHLGPGLLESAYQECLCYELAQAGIRFERELHLPIRYKTIKLDAAYRIDLLVEGSVVVEIKAVEQLLPVHSAQLLNYLKASNLHIGLLINFNVPLLKEGLQRIVNSLLSSSSPLPSPRLCVSASKERQPV